MSSTLKILTNQDLPLNLIEAIEIAAAPAKVHKASQKNIFLQLLPDAHILYGFHFPPNTGQAPQLRWVQLSSAGADLLRGSGILESNVIITTVSGAHSIAVSEYVLSLLLLFNRRWPQVLAAQQAGHWVRKDERSILLNYELFGKTIGIIGMGNIGRRIAHLSKSIGLRVLAVSRTSSNTQRDYDVDQFYALADLTILLKQAHFVVICVPLTPLTTNLIGEAEFQEMRSDAFLINISRGEVIDQDMLLKALDEGWISGAGLDVVKDEPLPDGHRLLIHPKVIISPHIAGRTHLYDEHAVAVFCNNLKLFRKNEPLRNVFDRQKGY